jgi:ribose 5-phosphate isomerase B
LRQEGYEAVDKGVFSETPDVDYPDIAQQVGREVVIQNGMGVLVCKTGIGMAISANKIDGVRAALVTNVLLAQLSRQHNDANVLCLGAHFVPFLEAERCLKTFLSTRFQPEERYLRRILKIKRMEENG